MSKKSMSVIVLLVVLGLALGVFGYQKMKAPNKSQKEITSNQPSLITTPEKSAQPIGFDKTKYSIDQPGSIWWIVNKKRSLPDGYVPPDLVVPNVTLRVPGNETMQISKTIQPALEEMFKDMKAAGFDMFISSGYRSYAYQVNLYSSYVAKDGQAAADKYSARPGTSEHQTGLAFDIGRTDKKCELEICLGELPEGKWLAENAHHYGFIVRYPNGKEDITGYQYEPWHLRYVGTEIATELHKTGQTMEEFFGLN